jgi:mannose-6-phosphate isomerase-like protein (cupin superfamily)
MLPEQEGLIEIHRYDEPGYRPLVFSAGWQVAVLNWEPLYEPENLGEIERHNATDEVFVLCRGRAALLVTDERAVRVVDMQPGLVYNVPRTVWHALLSTREASWIIVENRDTHLSDTEIRQMTAQEREHFLALAPDWS